MIIRRRVLLEAKDIKLQDVDRLVGKVVFGINWEESENPTIGQAQNWKDFKKLSNTTKYNFANACKDELLDNDNGFPFFEFLRGKPNESGWISDLNKMFLKCYNWTLTKGISLQRAKKGKKANILLVQPLYSRPDAEKIVDLYYNTKYNKEWKSRIADPEVQNELISSKLLTNDDINGNLPGLEEQDFVNYIFYDSVDRVRPYNTIKAILNILNGKETEDEEDQLKKKLANSTSEEQLQKIADSLTKEQADVLIPKLQQKK